MNTFRELISLQIGHFSNFVGSHLWNLQESSFSYDAEDALGKEIVHDVLFREGLTPQGHVTYTPRLVCVDLKGSLGSLKQHGALYDLPDAEGTRTWEGEVSRHAEDPIVKNDFLRDLDEQQEELEKAEDGEVEADAARGGESEEVFGLRKLYDLDDSVHVWSDYLRTHLHPRSLNLVQSHWHASDVEPFDVCGLGRGEVWEGGLGDELEDSLHFFTEDADHLQGFQVVCDVTDGFGGVTSRVLDLLADDFGTRGCLCVPVFKPHAEPLSARGRLLSIANTVLTFASLLPHSGCVTPLSTASQVFLKKPHLPPPRAFPLVQYKGSLAYHSSAVLTSALDGITLPVRTNGNSITSRDVCDLLTEHGAKVCSVNTAFPLALEHGASLAGQANPPWTPLTPHVSNKKSTGSPRPLVPGHIVTCRGLSRDMIGRTVEGGPKDMSARDVLAHTVRTWQPSLSAYDHVVQSRLKVTEPFPHIFDPAVSAQGHVSSLPRPSNTGVSEVATLTHVTSGAQGFLSALHEVGLKCDVKGLPRLLESGVEEDEYNEALEGIRTELEKQMELT